MIIRNRHIPPGKGFYAINLFGLIFTKVRLAPEELNHEYIHTLQQRETLFVGFYIIYIIEWGIRLLRYRNALEAYRNISFEREAYHQMYNLGYRRQRRLWAWMKYMFRNPYSYK